jgi:hypothetical protein
MLPKSALVLLAALVALTPLAQAHGSPNPIDAEDLILDDEATDNTAVSDGADIQTVHIREAFMQGVDGIVVRWTLWMSSAEGGAGEHVVTLTFDEPVGSMAWSSTDDGRTWTGPGTVLETEYEQDTVESGNEIPTSNVQFQGFVPLSEIGVSVGDYLNTAVATAHADGDIVDIAPGGYYAAGSDQEINEPQPPILIQSDESFRVIDSLHLDGADRYTKSVVTYTDGVVQVDVTNLITVAGQHVFAKTSMQPAGNVDEHDEAGNHVAGAISLDPGQGTNFTIPVDGFDTLEVFVETDLGGREVFYVSDDGTVSSQPLDFNEGDPVVEAPSAPVAIIALALLAAVAIRRRS